MKSYETRVFRKWLLWLIGTVVFLLVLLSLGNAFLSLVEDVTNQHRFLLLIGGAFITISFFFGQLVQSVLVKSWDTWLGDLGPLQLSILLEEMNKRKSEAPKGKNG